MKNLTEEICQLKSELDWLRTLWARRLPSYAFGRRRAGARRAGQPTIPPQAFSASLYCVPRQTLP